MKRKTQSYTAPPPKTPPKRGKKRGGKRRTLEIDVSRGPVMISDSYVPGGDPDDT